MTIAAEKGRKKQLHILLISDQYLKSRNFFLGKGVLMGNPTLVLTTRQVGLAHWKFLVGVEGSGVYKNMCNVMCR